MVTVISKGKNYRLNREEFQRYIKNLWLTAQARKTAREDMKAEREKAKGV